MFWVLIFALESNVKINNENEALCTGKHYRFFTWKPMAKSIPKATPKYLRMV
jgi:hypothetical protein